MKYVFGGFDGHGSSTGVARARDQKVPLSQVIIRYPECSAEGLPKLLYSMNLANDEIEIIDIPVNVKNPAEWSKLMGIISQNNTVTIYDHHSTNLKFLNQVPQGVRLMQFDNTITMLNALVTSEENQKIGLIGSITDRDPAIKTVLDIEGKEFVQMYNIANAYDVVIRANNGKGLQDMVKNVYENGFSYLQQLPQAVEYPPAKLSNQVSIVKFDNIVTFDASKIDLQAWSWKLLDYILWQTHSDYGIMKAQVLDRQINQKVPALFIAKYWLSDAKDPLPIVKPILGNRKTFGHESAFSVSLVSEAEADDMIEKVVSALQSQYSSVAEALGKDVIGLAVQSDYQKIQNLLLDILKKQTEILERMDKHYEQYLQLKEKQVNLLEKSNNTRFD